MYKNMIPMPYVPSRLREKAHEIRKRLWRKKNLTEDEKIIQSIVNAIARASVHPGNNNPHWVYLRAKSRLLLKHVGLTDPWKIESWLENPYPISIDTAPK
jgi:hypothetical protein